MKGDFHNTHLRFAKNKWFYCPACQRLIERSPKKKFIDSFCIQAGVKVRMFRIDQLRMTITVKNLHLGRPRKATAEGSTGLTRKIKKLEEKRAAAVARRDGTPRKAGRPPGRKVDPNVRPFIIYAYPTLSED